MPPLIVDIIPQSDSAETNENSEPSIAVNPTNTSEMMAGSFGPAHSDNEPYFVSLDGGLTWSHFAVTNNDDKSLAVRKPATSRCWGSIQR